MKNPPKHKSSNAYLWFQHIMIAVNFLLLYNAIWACFMVNSLGASSIKNRQDELKFITISAIIIFILIINLIISFIATNASLRLRKQEHITKIHEYSQKLFPIITGVVYSAIIITIISAF